MTCTRYDWCYFETKCSIVRESLKPLIFTLGTGSEAESFTVPADSYLFQEVDPSYKVEVCHLGIIGQDYHNLDYWVLGETFLQNYYVAFDATNDYPYVGLTLDKGSIGEISGDTPLKSIYLIVIILLIFLLSIFCLLVVLCLSRKHQRRKGKNARDLLSRKKRIDNEEDSSEEED